MSYKTYLQDLTEKAIFEKNISDDNYFKEIFEKVDNINNSQELLETVKLCIECQAKLGKNSANLDYGNLLIKYGLDQLYIKKINYNSSLRILGNKLAERIKKELDLNTSCVISCFGTPYIHINWRKLEPMVDEFVYEVLSKF